MTFELPKLPYALDALAPHLSRETLEYHHGKHHAAYVEKLNGLIADDEKRSLEEIIRGSDGALFENAAQHWNHSLYWRCMSPSGGGEPPTELADALAQAFRSVGRFKERFEEAASDVFGSGWAWLVRRRDGRLDLLQTPNAENPLIHDATALLTCDMWEHAFYIDYRNAKEEYLHAFWNVVDWNAVQARL